MKSFITLPKLKAGDQVAILSPAGDAAARFPWVCDFALERLRNEFNLRPKEYSTTRQIGRTHDEKARDLMAAFEDSENKAVIATLGGYDQVRLIKHLRPEVFINNPKPFFGYSDNSHFINFLWNIGIPAYYGGCFMIQFGYQGQDDITTKYLKKALFESSEVELVQAKEFNDETVDWNYKDTWKSAAKWEPNEGWLWDGQKDAEGILWGGCLESLVATFVSRQSVPTDADVEGLFYF